MELGGGVASSLVRLAVDVKDEREMTGGAIMPNPEKLQS
jgi:hypothetical protein